MESEKHLHNYSPGHDGHDDSDDGHDEGDDALISQCHRQHNAVKVISG